MALRVPLLAATLMVAVGAIVTNLVLRRLAADQQLALQQLAETYLDGLSNALLPYVIRRDVWEAFDVLDRARGRYTAVKAREVVVALADGTILAAANPRRFRTGSPLPARLFRSPDLAIDETAGVAWVSRTLAQESVDLGRIIAELDIGSLLQVRREVLITLVLLNGGLTLLFGAVGYLIVRRMLRPISILTRHVDAIRDGSLVPVPSLPVRDRSTEIGRLFASFNSMAEALREREALAARLAQGEKIALLGRLASGMAHEVNNPLGGMLNVVDTLRVHGDDRAVRLRAVELLERGLTGIANVVRATLATYKGSARPGRLEPRDLEDLQFLLRHELGRRKLRLDWRNLLSAPVEVDGAAVRQITLNLLLNACAASPEGATVTFAAHDGNGQLSIAIGDQGPGLPEEVARLLRHPDTAPAVPSDGVGLGVWTVCHLASRHRGRIEVASAGGGTSLHVHFPIGSEGALHAA
jgi:signal transduction histidine kinase